MKVGVGERGNHVGGTRGLEETAGYMVHARNNRAFVAAAQTTIFLELMLFNVHAIIAAASLNVIFTSSPSKWFSLPCSYGRRGACGHGRFPSVLQWEWVSLLVVERGELPSHSPTQVQGCRLGVHMQACVWVWVWVCGCVCGGGGRGGVAGLYISASETWSGNEVLSGLEQTLCIMTMAKPSSPQ